MDRAISPSATQEVTHREASSTTGATCACRSQASGGSSGAASYELSRDGFLSTVTGPVETGQLAACWLVASKDRRFAFVANAASASVSTFAVSPGGEVSFQRAVRIAADPK